MTWYSLGALNRGRQIVLSYSNSVFTPKRMRRASWLALLALAWLQVSLASHQLEHEVTSVSDSCHVCVQFERLDDVAAHQPAIATAVPHISALAPLPEAVGHRQTVARVFNSRAPPQL